MRRRADPLITLTTDFGTGSPYVAAVKGVILGINPRAHIVDLSHQIPPQDVRYADFFLAEAIPHFPPGGIHVVVVDPGVGTERALLCFELGERLGRGGSQLVLAPDNGVCSQLLLGLGWRRTIRLVDARYWRKSVSHTFHGRDILAPVAAHLSLGLDPRRLGPTTRDYKLVELPDFHVEKDRIRGEVVFVDWFGNLFCNLRRILLDGKEGLQVEVAGQRIARFVRTYGEAKPGELVALISSNGWLEIAEVNGNAARRLNVGVGAPIAVRWTSERAKP